jgi:citrate lyase beta subunit
MRIRSVLFTPGTDADRLRKAVHAGADVCIFDLEDSVPADRIEEARTIVGQAVRELHQQATIWVRIHAGSSREMVEDLTAIPLDEIAAVVLPKVDGSGDLAACKEAIAAAGGPPLLPLIAIVESAAGVVSSSEIARTIGVAGLALGKFDLSADLGIDPRVDSPALLAARAAVVLASAAAGLPPPLDSPWLDVRDLVGLRNAAERARRDGFGGMLLIHPTHVEVVHDVFRSTDADVRWARDVISSNEQAVKSGRGVFVQAGQMVDEAILRRARAILDEFGT